MERETRTHGVTRRGLLGGSAAGGAMAVLTACGAGGAPGSQPTPKQPLTGEVRWQVYSVTGTRNADLRNSTMAAMSEKYPGVKFVLDIVGTTYFGPYLDKIRASIASDTAPDVFLVTDTDTPSFIGQKSVLDLDPYVKRDKYDLSDFPAEIVNYVRSKGGLYGMPDNSAMIGFYGNADLFKQVGLSVPVDNADTRWTFDAAVDAAQRVNRLSPAGAPGTQAIWGISPNYATFGWIAWVRSNGGEFAKPDYTESTLHEPQAFEALQYLADLRYRTHVAAAPNDQAGNMNDAFVQGRLGLNETCVSCQLGAVRTTMTQDFDAAVRPVGKGGKRVYHLYAHSQMAWRGTKNPDLTWESLKWFEDVAMVTLVKEGILQGTKIQAHQLKYWLDPAKAPKNGKLWIEATQKYARPVRGTTNWTDLESLFTEELAPLWNGQRTAREAVQSLKPRLDALLKAGRVEG